MTQNNTPRPPGRDLALDVARLFWPGGVVVPPPPAPFYAQPRGVRLVAGLGHATVLPDMDFETYSEAGYIWNQAEQKWTSPKGATTKGLPVVGVAYYAEHVSTEVLSLCYDLKDGQGARRWAPGSPPPLDLFAYLAVGGLVEAWNSGFEWYIWNKVCMRRYGWPELPLAQLRCAMAKSRAHSLPGALGKAGEVLQLQYQKDADGDRLLKKFSMPRNPTKGDPRTRITLADDPEDGGKLLDYNERDILSEAEASSRIPDLEGEELEFWLLDQRINRRGVAIDVGAVQDCIAIVEQAHAQYNAELWELTGGAVARASELAKLKVWLAGHGVFADAMDEDAIDLLLKRPGLPAPARRALEIRGRVGSASVKKLFSMANQATSAGRLHELFTYHGARTGRTTGSGPQPTNLPKAGPAVRLCACGHYFGAHTVKCPWCFAVQPPSAAQEWTAAAVEDALCILSTRDLATVEHFFGDAMLTISGCLRGLFVAAPGHDLVCSDYSAIEAVVLAMVAGVKWREEVFRTHGKIYEASAAKVIGVPVEEVVDYKKAHGKHHPARPKGKVLELACFGPDTQVLTRRGYVAIVDVLSTDQLWDGVEWVSHKGVVPRGKRAVLRLDGVKMTPDHKINCGGFWKEAHELDSNESTLCLALATGSENLPSSGSTSDRPEAFARSRSSARAVGLLTVLTRTICGSVGRPGATPALSAPAGPTPNGTTRTPTLWPMTSTGAGCSTESPPVSADATGRTTRLTRTTAAGGSRSTPRGVPTNALSSHTLSRCLDGIAPLWSWIGRTATAATCPGIFGLSPRKKTTATGEKSPTCSAASTSWSDVYDIALAGPRSRFTIRTNRGHLLVHNCGYGGWVGAMLAFGAGEYMTEEEMKTMILEWRAASPEIPEFWGGQWRRTSRGWRPELYGVEGMFVAAILQPGTEYQYKGFKFLMRGDALYLTLLSGRHMVYHRPRLHAEDKYGRKQYRISYEGWNTNPKNGPPGWVRIDTYGGRMTENIVQATARDIQWHGMKNLEAAGYPIVLHVYDEDVAEVPTGFGETEEFERIMSTMPPWCADWPIRAAGGWRGRRYRKD